MTNDEGSQPTAEVAVAEPSRTDRLEVITAVLLGLATVLTAFAAYQASLWGGKQDAALTQSVRASNAAVDAYQEDATQQVFDQTLFIEFVTLWVQVDEVDEEQFLSDDGLGGFIRNNMSPRAYEATEEWFENDQYLPFDSDEYWAEVYAVGNELSDISDDLFAEAGTYNKNGDDYVLASTLLASVLFFTGISAVLRSPRLRMGLLAGSGVLLIGASIFVATLPRTT